MRQLLIYGIKNQCALSSAQAAKMLFRDIGVNDAEIHGLGISPPGV
jgi:hypothetical protein